MGLTALEGEGNSTSTIIHKGSSLTNKEVSSDAMCRSANNLPPWIGY